MRAKHIPRPLMLKRPADPTCYSTSHAEQSQDGPPLQKTPPKPVGRLKEVQPPAINPDPERDAPHPRAVALRLIGRTQPPAHPRERGREAPLVPSYRGRCFRRPRQRRARGRRTPCTSSTNPRLPLLRRIDIHEARQNAIASVSCDSPGSEVGNGSRRDAWTETDSKSSVEQRHGGALRPGSRLVRGDVSPGATPAQEHAWPAIAAGENVLLISPTGTGKTLAAFLAILDRLFRAEAEDTRCQACGAFTSRPFAA